MNRIVSKSVQRVLLQNNTSIRNRRLLSSDSSSGGKAKFVAIGGAGVAVASTLLYAKFDDDFRKELRTYLPFIDTIVGEENKRSLNGSAAKMDSESFMKIKKTPEIAETLPVPNEEPKKKQKKSKSEKKEAAAAIQASAPVEPVKAVDNKEIDLFSPDEIKKQIAASFDAVLNDDTTKLGEKDHENELRTQMKRQLYVLQDFFQEQLILYKTEMKRKCEMDLKDLVAQEKNAIAKDFEDSFRKLKSMESLLQVRDSLDKQEKATKHLYLLGQALTNLLEHNRTTLSHETAPLSIEAQISCIQKVVNEHFPEETLIKLALEALPESVKKSGVYSEEDLIRRFTKVEKMANQVALVNHEYANLFDYIKSIGYSYVRPLQEYDFSMSLTPVQKKQISQQELNGSSEVDPTQWDTFDVMKRVRFCIENHNLEQALRYANQLKGEPRKIAQDWIRDTREHLEVKQAVRLVQTKIAALNLQQINVIH